MKHSTIRFNYMVKSSAKRLDIVFHALSDPTRRSILRDVSITGKTVGEIASRYPISLAAVSKHLKVLDTAELIARERRGSFQVVRLRATRLREAEKWLGFYRQFWTDRLDAMVKNLEENGNG